MKKPWMLLSICLSLSLLTACASGVKGSPTPGGVPSDEPPIETETTQPALVTETFRIVAAEGPGHPPLLLAKLDGNTGEVYILPSCENISVTPEWADDMNAIDWSYQAGSLLEITHNGTLLETYPLQFSKVSEIHVLEGGFDDRCALYLEVLEDLWKVDSGLNGGVEVIGVDLSQTSLNPAERAAVAWVFAGNHGAEAAEGTWNELVEQGYISASPLVVSGSGEDLGAPQHFFYEWKNGCHFSITEQPMEGVYSLVPVTFDAQKWRSSLGAYFFMDCTAVQSALGQWSDYHIGAEAIS